MLFVAWKSFLPLFRENIAFELIVWSLSLGDRSLNPRRIDLRHENQYAESWRSWESIIEIKQKNFSLIFMLRIDPFKNEYWSFLWRLRSFIVFEKWFSTCYFNWAWPWQNFVLKFGFLIVRIDASIPLIWVSYFNWSKFYSKWAWTKLDVYSRLMSKSRFNIS